MNTKIQPNEIAEMVTRAETCESMIQLLDDKIIGLTLKEMSAEIRFKRKEDERLLLSEKIQDVNIELHNLNEIKELPEGEYKKDIQFARQRLEYTLYRHEHQLMLVSSDSMALPMFQSYLVATERTTTEEFVKQLQLRLKKLTSKPPKDKTNSTKGRQEKAA